MNRKDSAAPASRIELPLALRRDRGYVYFPDALKAGLDFLPNESWSEVQGECYKTSAKRIFFSAAPTEDFDRRADGLFGSITLIRPSGQRSYLLWESDKEITDWFDLDEPSLSLRFSGRTLEAEPSGSLFPSDFHRFALLCKKLYHHADPDGGKRMLLQRMRILTRSRADSAGKDVISLDFLSRERFLRFSISRDGVPFGEVIATARPPGEIHV